MMLLLFAGTVGSHAPIAVHVAAAMSLICAEVVELEPMGQIAFKDRTVQYLLYAKEISIVSDD